MEMKPNSSICGYDGCGRRKFNKGYCATHYRRSVSGKDMSLPILTPNGKQGCLVEGCDRKHEAIGYCSTHYRRLKSGKDLDTPIRVFDTTRICSVQGCSKPYLAKGMCEAHYHQQWESKHECSLEWCEKKHQGNGYCNRHNQVFRLYGDTEYVRTLVRVIDLGELDCQAGCGKPATVIDHCHTSGKVRGGLCTNCNRGIGLIGDTAERLGKALEYLKAM